MSVFYQHNGNLKHFVGQKSARGTSSTESWKPVVHFVWIFRPHQWPTCHPIWLAFRLIKAFVAPQTGCITISAPHSPVFMATWHYKQGLKEIGQFLCASPYGQKKVPRQDGRKQKQPNPKRKLKTLNLHTGSQHYQCHKEHEKAFLEPLLRC